MFPRLISNSSAELEISEKVGDGETGRWRRDRDGSREIKMSQMRNELNEMCSWK